MNNSTNKPQKPQPKRRRRRRLLLLALLVLATTLTVAYLVLTRGPIARRIVLAQLQPLSDAKIDIRSATIAPSGTITIQGLSVRAPALDGNAARILDAQSATISIAGLLTGSPRPTAIHIDNPILRISQDTQTGAFNFNTIHFRSTGASDAPLPAVTITTGVLELGEHTGADEHPLRRLPIEATLAPAAAPDTYAFTIVQGDPDAAPFSLTGTIDPERVTVDIDELDLAAWPNEAIPSRVRDLHRQLAIKGRVLPTSLTITRAGQIDMLVELKGVELQLPVENAPLATGFMTAVDGSLRIDPTGLHAQLDGQLDGVPATATLHADKLSQDSPFTCEIHIGRVQLAENLERLAYIPEFVREQLEIFSSPSAQIALDLVLTRGNAHAEVVPSGSIRLFNGVASYREFPYEFSNLQGTFELTKDALTFHDLTGSAPSGAQLEATGEIGPLGPTAAAKIDIVVHAVPLDAQLRSGLGPNHKKLFDALLNRDAYRQLLDLNLIQTGSQQRSRTDQLETLRAADQTPERDARIAELESILPAPTFVLGGKSTVEVHIYRYEGEENRWDRNIVVKIPRAGFLPEQFPLPIFAEDVTLNIVNNTATLAPADGTFHGIDGGTATIAAVAKLATPDAVPNLTIEASEIPVTPLLIRAIPGDPDADTAGARDLLTRLGLDGTLDATASIGHPDRPLFQIDVRPRAINASVDDWTPPAGEPITGLRLTDITGNIRAEPDSIELNLYARIPTAAAEIPPLAHMAAGIDYGPAVPGAMQIRTLDAAIDALPLSTPIEQLVALVNEPAAEQLHKLRNRFEPRGTVSVTVAQNLESAGPPSTHLALTEAHDLRLRFHDADFALAQSTGRITLTRGQTTGIALEDFGGTATYGDQPLGTLNLNGTINPTADTDANPATGHVAATLTDGNYVAPLIQALLPDSQASLRDLLTRLDPAATFDLHADLAVINNRSVALESLRLTPHTLAITHADQRIALTIAEGSATVTGSAANLDNLVLNAPDWSATLSGRVSAPEPDALDADLAFTLAAASLTPDLQSILPPALNDVFEQLALKIEGPIRLDQGHLLLANRAGASRTDILGHLDINQASASAGIDIDRMVAAIDFVAHTDSSLPSPDFEIRIDAPEFRAAQIWMTDGSMRLRSSPEGGATEIGPITADAHGGRVAASAFLWNGVDGEPQYDLDATLSGVRFAPVLRDLALDTSPPEPDAEADESRGVIDARLTMYGLTDGPRRGVGHIQVSQGRVLKLPLLVPLIEVSNLRLPMGEQLDLARAQFFINDDLATFEELSVISRSIELIGYGTLDLTDQNLDLRVNSRSANPLPFLSPVFEGLRDELVTIRVRGTLRQPDIATVPLSTTRAAIAGLFGREQTPQDRLLRDIKRRALELRERSRLSSKQIKTAIENLNDQDNNQSP